MRIGLLKVLFFSLVLCLVSMRCFAVKPNLSYPGSPYTFTVGVAVNIIPGNTGGTPTATTLNFTLPAGLSISATGVISGTPTAIASATTYTVTTSNANGTQNPKPTFSITVVSAPVFTYSTPNVYVVGTPVTLTPTNTGNAATSCTIASVPAGATLASVGLSISATGVISGTPTAILASTTFVVTATNAVGTSTSNNFTITINPAAPAITYPTPQTYNPGVAITTLSATNTGGPATSYTTTGLPAGLSLNAATGDITGAPTTITGIAAADYSVTATNITGSSTFNINITINPAAPVITYTSPDTYAEGVAITALNPTNTGGTVATTYTTTGLPAGLAINAATGIITGTPTTLAGIAAANYSVTATNVNGSSSFNINITINEAAPVIAYATPQTYVAGVAITTLSATNTGGPVTTYTTTGLPPGLSLNAATGDITGTPTTLAGIAQTSYMVTGTNSTGSSTATIKIKIDKAAPVITYPTPDTYTAGTAIATLSATNTGGPVATYTTTGLPAGLSLNAATGDITGTPTTAAGIAAANYSITATNTTGSSTFLINITINPVPAPGITYTTPDTYTAGVAITALNPTNTGGTLATTYSTTGLPAGLVISTATGAITGTPTTLAGIAAANYSVTATNVTGSSTFNINITINPAAPAIAYVTPQTYTAGVAITALNPSNTGGPVTTYTTAGLPAGLSLNAATGAITGTPTTLAGIAQASYTVTGTNSTGSSTATIKIKINKAAPAVTYPTPDTYTAGTAVATLSPTNTGGPVATYTTTGLPAGLTLNAASGAITGTPTTIAGIAAANYSVTATNTTGSSTFSINITINPEAPAITYTTPNTWYTGTAYSLSPTNTGGPGTTWSITGSLPAGVTFDTTTGIISGTPTAVLATTTYSVTATNVSGSSTTSVVITVDEAIPVITYDTPDVYTVGGSVSLIPTNSNAAGTTSYAITVGTLPAGLSINTTTGVISGTATTITATVTLTIFAYTGTSSGSTTVTITINPLAPAISYTNPSPYAVGTAISPLTPANSGGPVAIGGLTYGTGTVILKAANGLNNPYGMAVDAAGNVYTVNFTGNNITEYSTTGTVTTFSTGAGTGPVGIGFDSSGNAYVLEQTNNTVVEFTGGLSGAQSTIITGLSTPTGLTIDASNNLYVANSGNNTITKYSSAGGAPTLTITTSATKFISGGVAVDATGNIYVVDSGTTGVGPSYIDEYSSTGTYTRRYREGKTDAGLYIDGNGYIFFTSIGNKRAHVFTSGFTTDVATETGFSSPRGVVTDGQGNMYVSDYNNNTVTEYPVVSGYYLTGTLPAGLSFNTTTGTFSGTPQTTLPPTTYTVTAYNVSGKSTTTVTISCILTAPAISYTPSTNSYCIGTPITTLLPVNTGGPVSAMTYSSGTSITGGTINGPYGITTDASGNFYVTNYNVGIINEYNSNGVYQTTIGGTFTSPIGIVFDSSGNAYVADRTTDDIYQITPAGVKTTYITGIGNLRGIAIDASNNLYITSGSGNRIYKYSTGGATGTLVTTFPTTYTSAPAGIAIDPSGNVYVTDRTRNQVIEFTSGGTYITTFATGFTTADGISIDAGGNVYVSNSAANKIDVYNSIGVLLTTISSNASVPSGTITDSYGNIFSTNFSNATIYEYLATGNYTISPALPAGLAFNTVTGAITGTPTANSPATVYTIACSNATGTASTTVTITTATTPVFTYTTPDVYNTGPTITPLTPTITGGTPTSYSVSPALPAGLAIDPVTGIISGAPTAVSAAANYVITGTNSCGVGTFTVNITVNLVAPVIAYTSPDVFQVGLAITPLSPTNTGGPPAAYTISPALPAGLSFDNTTGIISGTPTAASPATNYLVSATNSGGTGTFTINITCTVPLIPVVAYTTPDVYTVGAAITPLNPNNTGGTATWSISPGLPAGLSFDTTTGIISGTPTAISAAANYLVTATNAGGTATQTINIACNPPAPVVAYTTPDVYTVGTAITPLNPNNTGGVATWSVSPALPAGLNFDTTTGIISGTPAAISAAANYLVTATNAGGTATQTINITCNPPAPVISYASPNVYNTGVTITPLTPANTGGAAASWSVSPALPAGLSFDTTTGIISGTPTTITANFGYVVSATNAGGTGTFTVLIAVNLPAPVIAYTTPDVYTVGAAIAPLLPASTGGTPASYGISPGLPSGLSFNTSTGAITGTPTAVSGAANYLVTATNAGGQGTFTVNISCVASGPVLSYTTPDLFPVGAAITPLNPVNTGTAPVSYAISPGLPAGLNFNTGTGAISGTPTASSPATTYTVTATDAASNTGTATISIACSGYVDWIGVTSTDWNTATNWATGAVPTVTDIAGIGVNQTFDNFPNVLAGAGTINVGAVVIGTSSTQVSAVSTVAQAGGFVVNAGSTLNVSGAITYQSDVNSGLGLIASISGAGSVTASGIDVNANTTLAVPAAYTQTITSSVSSLGLTSNIALTSTVDAGSNALNASLTITGGTVSLAGILQTSNAAGSISAVSVIPATTATLQLANAAPLSGLSATGTNTISFNNTGATVEYSGAAQTYYTNAAITGLASGPVYNSLKFSGTGVKTPSGTNANTLTINGDFTNALTLNDASDYIDLSLPNVIFNGATQNIYAGNGTGTGFYNTTFSGSGTTTIQSGNAYIASTGVLTMSGSSAVLAAGGLLTLNSDVNGAATVAPIPTGCSITGTVNVQRYITGGPAHRGYRLLSSPVYASTVGGNNVISINYLINSCYIKGTTGVPGGFDAAGNPNLFLFRENLVPSNATFTSGNYRGINTLGTGITNVSYLIDIDGGPYNIPVGNGYLFFFRGDRNVASLATESATTYVPTSTTLTASGTLNQGQVTVSDWYTPTSANLGLTTISGTPAIEGFNLVGNPYASSIDWDQFNTTSPNTGIYGGAGAAATNPFIYVTDPVSQNYNVYAAGSGGLGTIVPTLSNIIPSGQGFFVQAGSATSQLVFNESAKTNVQANAANGNLLMGHPPAATAIARYLHLRIVQDSTNSDGILISFRSNTSTKYVRGEDAMYLKGHGTVSLASISTDSIALSINAMPLPPRTGQTVIPLVVNAAVDGTYQLKMEAKNSIPKLFTIWLKDAYRDDSLDMRANSTYKFDILHSDTNTYGSHRFTLVMGQDPALMLHLLQFSASKVKGGDQVVWTTENEENYTNFTVERSTDGGKTFDILGGFASTAQGTYSYLDQSPVNGANQYRLQIVDINGTVTYSNVVTIMYANTGNQVAINGLMLYPNPTASMINLSIAANQGVTSAPAYSIEIVNNLGSVIKSARSSSPLWQSDVSTLTPGTYFVRVIDTSNNTVVGKSAFVKL